MPTLLRQTFSPVRPVFSARERVIAVSDRITPGASRFSAARLRLRVTDPRPLPAAPFTAPTSFCPLSTNSEVGSA
jgi:hypothetical protein